MEAVPKALDCGSLLPLSSSAACCTLHRDEVAELFWTHHPALECRHRRSRAANSSKRQQGCAQSKDASRHNLRSPVHSAFMYQFFHTTLSLNPLRFIEKSHLHISGN
jgi:hypothetical protein